MSTLRVNSKFPAKAVGQNTIQYTTPSGCFRADSPNAIQWARCQGRESSVYKLYQSYITADSRFWHAESRGKKGAAAAAYLEMLQALQGLEQAYGDFVAAN